MLTQRYTVTPLRTIIRVRKQDANARADQCRTTGKAASSSPTRRMIG